jgi:ribosome maturation factor RimP
VDAAARRLADLVRPLGTDAARQEGVELVDVEFRRESAGWVLRVFIDKAGGVSLDDCKRVSEVVGTLLEVEDLIPHAYTLEVSSPGLTRPLQSPGDWSRSVGSLVKIVTRQAMAGRQAFVGRLLEVLPASVRIDVDGEAIEVPTDLIARARREVEWPPAAGERARRKRGRPGTKPDTRDAGSDGK